MTKSSFIAERTLERLGFLQGPQDDDTDAVCIDRPRKFCIEVNVAGLEWFQVGARELRIVHRVLVRQRHPINTGSEWQCK